MKKLVANRSRRALSPYAQATRDRAEALARALVANRANSREMAFAIWAALDEARSMGFGAGVAFGRSR